jgi:septal ring factor EnvC (AmiA/AmiB activator)
MPNSDSVNKIADIWKNFGSFINTCLLIIGIVTMTMGLGRYFESIENRVDFAEKSLEAHKVHSAREWSEHMSYHQARLVESKEYDAKMDLRIQNTEREVRTVTESVRELSYRVAANEQTSNNLMEAVKAIQASQSEQAGDIKVVKEILQRLEASRKIN